MDLDGQAGMSTRMYCPSHAGLPGKEEVRTGADCGLGVHTHRATTFRMVPQESTESSFKPALRADILVEAGEQNILFNICQLDLPLLNI